MKTKIKAENIIEVQAIVALLTLEFGSVNIEITKAMINCEMKFYIVVKNKDIHPLDIYRLLQDNKIMTYIHFTINGRGRWAPTY